MEKLSAVKFQQEKLTAGGDARAFVDLERLDTLWLNTGTRCNLTCQNCYIESSPTNDRLVYLRLDDVTPFFKEQKFSSVKMVGITGGEPFINPEIISIIEAVLLQGREVLILTNGNRVLERYKSELVRLKQAYAGKLHIRVSLDHYTKALHDKERGTGSFDRALAAIKWLDQEGFHLSIAGRSLADDMDSLGGYQDLLQSHRVSIDLKEKLVIFPEMIMGEDVPEISVKCWDILGKKPQQQMCAHERMIVKRKGAKAPKVLACTLLAYDERFELGEKLDDSAERVYLNHEFCAKFCVLGGASCSATK